MNNWLYIVSEPVHIIWYPSIIKLMIVSLVVGVILGAWLMWMGEDK